MKRINRNDLNTLYSRKFLEYCRSRGRAIAYKKRKNGGESLEKLEIRAVKNLTSDYFSKIGCTTKTGKVNKKISYNLPKDFCFIHSPSVALKAIYDIHQIASKEEVAEIHINHQKVKSYHLTSEVLLGLCVETERTKRKIRFKSKHSKSKKKRKLRVVGTLPSDPNHEQLIHEIGVVSEVKASTAKPLPLSTRKQHLFSKRSVGHSIASAYSNDDKTKTSVKFVDYVNRCIRDHRLGLTDDATSKLQLAISEVLDNSERHATSDDGKHIWHARGYLNSESEQENLEISLFNFGMSIAETFEELPDTAFGKQQVMSYANEHMVSPKNFSKDQLVTVAALQHRYSSKNKSENDTNGQGTIYLIEFFERLCEDLSELPSYERVKPEMSIVSGMTHILFDGTYRLSELPDYNGGGSDQFIIAFNKQNSLKLPPDTNYVKKLTEGMFFPGVAISIKVPLKEEGKAGDNSVD
ncbi:hypothetical protein [Thalassolituus maritimus]|uniref:Uncharacterized protein n=1 Tax=Thalassolituus maritimus TaxID=484498 RepID=A0ABP9ZWX7_9GAMM